MKTYKVRYWIDITVEAENRDEANELAGRAIEDIKGQELKADSIKLVQNRVKKKYHFSKDELKVIESKAHKLNGKITYDKGLVYCNFMTHTNAMEFKMWAIQHEYRVHGVTKHDNRTCGLELFWDVLLVARDVTMGY